MYQMNFFALENGDFFQEPRWKEMSLIFCFLRDRLRYLILCKTLFLRRVGIYFTVHFEFNLCISPVKSVHLIFGVR